jgi:hypothetical protein
MIMTLPRQRCPSSTEVKDHHYLLSTTLNIELRSTIYISIAASTEMKLELICLTESQGEQEHQECHRGLQSPR